MANDGDLMVRVLESGLGILVVVVIVSCLVVVLVGLAGRLGR